MQILYIFFPNYVHMHFFFFSSFTRLSFSIVIKLLSLSSSTEGRRTFSVSFFFFWVGRYVLSLLAAALSSCFDVLLFHLLPFSRRGVKQFTSPLPCVNGCIYERIYLL